MKLFSAFLLGAALLLQGETVTLPVAFQAGTIQSFSRTKEALSFTSLRKCAEANKKKAGISGLESLSEQVTPGEGRVFVVFTIKVGDNRKLSRFDYVLEAGGVAEECKGLAFVETGVFDFRLREAKPSETVLMVFESSETAEQAVLKSAFKELPLVPVGPFTLIEKQ